MRFLDETEIDTITRRRNERAEEAHTTYDWNALSIADLAILRAEAQEYVRLADEHIAKHVNFLRAGGDISWAELGKVLGVSRQAAQQKFG